MKNIKDSNVGDVIIYVSAPSIYTKFKVLARVVENVSGIEDDDEIYVEDIVFLHNNDEGELSSYFGLEFMTITNNFGNIPILNDKIPDYFKTNYPEFLV